MKLTRRDFLDNSILAAAAALAGTAPVSAAEPASVSTRRIGPNDKIRVAVIGVNGQGGSHLGEWLKNPDVDLVAICDCDPAAYREACRQVQGSDAAAARTCRTSASCSKTRTSTRCRSPRPITGTP